MIAKLKPVRAGLLHDLLTRGSDKYGQLRDPAAHPEQFKDSPLLVGSSSRSGFHVGLPHSEKDSGFPLSRE